jgi:hypothetical protein
MLHHIDKSLFNLKVLILALDEAKKSMMRLWAVAAIGIDSLVMVGP